MGLIFIFVGYALRLSSHSPVVHFSSLNLTILVAMLSKLFEIQLGVAYKHINCTPIKSFPVDLRLLEQLKVEYEVLPEWKSDIASIKNYDDLPLAARTAYVQRIEELVGIPVHYIGVRPGHSVTFENEACMLYKLGSEEHGEENP
ncbi:hypothetical protein F2P56_004268 [Juglans regia]|uniref:Adenylosuccinate synthase n=2 Tax=Juglans regia TaxID=51240 RepID=A0A834D5Y6_JUGRE|nr:adenylosuccinate synthetase 2, chloroplastic-like [Juglans regia]KAF5477648.1 hypothetical protein F2P56_004268 [Juglans regia]